MQPKHLYPLYKDAAQKAASGSGAAARIQSLAALAEELKRTGTPVDPGDRGPFTRFLDAGAAWLRKYIPVIHWLGAASFALVVFLYCHLVGLTSRLLVTGDRRWPDLPAPCILALWHGAAPAFLCAIAKQKPSVALVIMVAKDPRGDSLAMVCRLMGLRVVRGDPTHRGWEALAQMSGQVERGSCAVLTPDGGGPARFAKSGTVVLSAATGAPIVAVGANCAPAFVETHKWDLPRNPLPFGRIAVFLSKPITLPPVTDAASLEASRSSLQQELDNAANAAKKLLST